MTRKTVLDADFSGGLDRILKGICESLQLSQTQHRLAEEHYRAVSNWLEQPGSILAPFKPQIYPQGSLPMGVTNKPLGRDEYDLDFICELQLEDWQISPADLFSKFEYRIREHKDYRERMELGKRCICLKYAHDFHLDIVPACTNRKLGEGQVRIPDREMENWKDTNSRQYVKWFNVIADSEQDRSRLDKAEPLPPQEEFDDKSALKFAVQLMKRGRDLAFQDKDDLAPASIVLSTLAANGYSGNTSVSGTVAETLNHIQGQILVSPGRLQVWNPANQVSEDLGERWDKNPEAYEAFKDWIADFCRIWDQLERARGPEVNEILFSLFGENLTQAVIREELQRQEQARQAGKLGIVAGTGLLTTQSPAIAVPRNTFYGQ
jgi:hypothetical protein